MLKGNLSANKIFSLFVVLFLLVTVFCGCANKDETVDKLETAKKPSVVPVKPPVDNPSGGSTQPPAPKKVYKSLNRSIVFPAKRLESEADIDDYVEKMRESLKQLLRNCDGIQLK